MFSALKTCDSHPKNTCSLAPSAAQYKTNEILFIGRWNLQYVNKETKACQTYEPADQIGRKLWRRRRLVSYFQASEQSSFVKPLRPTERRKRSVNCFCSWCQRKEEMESVPTDDRELCRWNLNKNNLSVPQRFNSVLCFLSLSHHDH